MKIVIIGYGSIGRKHAELIKKNFKNVEIYILTKQKITGYKKIQNLKDIKKIDPKYIVISSETEKHFAQLKYLEKNFKNVNILVEKPLFNKYKKINIKNNKVFIGYNLRFHPIIILLRKVIFKKKAIDIKIITNSFLPNWRKNISYEKSYSAKKLGGGVTLDLSHELDLATWLFGKIKIEYLKIGKFSKLKINSEDTLKLIGKIGNSNFYLDLNYYSRNEMRTIIVDYFDKTVAVDLIKNEIKVIKNKSSKIIKLDKFNLNKTYVDLHKSIILNRNINYLCNFKNALNLQKFIEKIKKR